MFVKVINMPLSSKSTTNTPNKTKKNEDMNYISVLERLEKP